MNIAPRTSPQLFSRSISENSRPGTWGEYRGPEFVGPNGSNYPRCIDEGGCGRGSGGGGVESPPTSIGVDELWASATPSNELERVRGGPWRDPNPDRYSQANKNSDTSCLWKSGESRTSAMFSSVFESQRRSFIQCTCKFERHWKSWLLYRNSKDILSVVHRTNVRDIMIIRLFPWLYSYCTLFFLVFFLSWFRSWVVLVSLNTYRDIHTRIKIHA